MADYPFPFYVGMVTSLILLSAIALGLRLYTRGVILKRLLADDFLLVAVELLLLLALGPFIYGETRITKYELGSEESFQKLTIVRLHYSSYLTLDLADFL